MFYIQRLLNLLDEHQKKQKQNKNLGTEVPESQRDREYFITLCD